MDSKPQGKCERKEKLNRVICIGYIESKTIKQIWGITKSEPTDGIAELKKARWESEDILPT